MSTKTHWIVAYRQYGEWSCTRPFTSEQIAKDFKKQRLDSDEIRHKETGQILTTNTNAHIKDITIVPVELPE